MALFSPFKTMTQSLQSSDQHSNNNITMTRIRISGLKRFALVVCIATAILYLVHLQLTMPTDGRPVKIDIETDTEVDAPSWPLQINNERKSIYTPSMFTPEQVNQNHYLPITAVIQRVSDNEHGIQHVVKHLLKYPFIKEVYIYNHIPSRAINIQDFRNHSSNSLVAANIRDDVSIRIIESVEQLSSMSRFTTCAIAAYDHCYFQDDLALNLYMDTLYTNFLQHPDIVHATARATVYPEYIRWRFFNPDIQMHTGYADFRYGAFVSREKVQTFLSQMSALQQQGIFSSWQSFGHAETAFVIWTNQYPWLLANPLLPGGREPPITIDPVNNRYNVQKNMMEALRQLEYALQHPDQNNLKDIYTQQETTPSLAERDTRVSCGNDKCLFTTSMSPYPDPASMRFSSEEIMSIRQWDARFEEYDIPLDQNWLSVNSYHLAVDQDLSTCWNSHRRSKVGDYFGLNMIGTIRAKRLLIHTGQRIRDPTNVFGISVADTMDHWVECRISLIQRDQAPQRVALSLDDCPGVQAFRAIRITFKQDQAEAFTLCGLTLDNMTV